MIHDSTLLYCLFIIYAEDMSIFVLHYIFFGTDHLLHMGGTLLVPFWCYSSAYLKNKQKNSVACTSHAFVFHKYCKVI